VDYPLGIHKLAFRAAETAHCAGEQGKYWEMHDRLFANQRTLEPWRAHAEAVGLDVSKFEECLGSGRYAGEVRKGMAEARKAGLTGTPVSFLAYTAPEGSTVDTEIRITGAQPFSAFKKHIDKLLGAAKAEEPR
jgi:protein-disulfide isomerase